ncbi:MAG: branched-chain amino acid ABC transporter substrate-binding protein [SAR86 cluster bacterium]|uniref:Branched-chain amino acid ABC transporter substrate-binding protein n=1 Tax=SAR86 cluster bacterium TaxID=2030880 RepID=A0A2A4MSB8_9GAMM|nr:MAG: branched-chain amino acid ABC transporter substrate-binding protein [SAR86 cluster bacterium]
MLSITSGSIFIASQILFSSAAIAQQPIRIAFIDPLSGAFASSGVNALRQFQFAAQELVNSQGGLLGGRPLEIVGFDNKANVQESLLQLRRAIGQNMHYVIQGNGSSVGSAIASTLGRHNRRNPEQRLLYLNYAAVDPALSNEDCSFWHFSFDAHAIIKMQALTDLIAQQEDVKKVYIIGQDYSFGKVVADTAISMLASKRPDIEIVGNELHPMEVVKDFTPYVTKIAASGADAIITGNWGADMVSLAKSITEVGIDVPVYTYYAAYDGITATLGESGKNQFRMVHGGYFNPQPTKAYADYIAKFKQQYPQHDISYPRIILIVEMLAAAIELAGTDDPLQVALAFEGMQHTNIHGEPVLMRRGDHQLFQAIQISVHTDEGIVFGGDNSPYGLHTEASIALEDTLVEHSCEMTRPDQ